MRARFVTWPDAYERRVEIRGGSAYVVFPFNGELVFQPDGTFTRREFTYVETPSNASDPVYVVECGHDASGLPIVEAVHVMRRPDGGREVRSSDLRQVRSLADVIEDAWKLASLDPSVVIGEDEDEVALEFGRLLAAQPRKLTHQVRGLRRQARRKLTPALLAEVSEVYRANMDTGAPTKAVGEHFGLASSTASLYVRKAREAGMDMGSN